MAKTYIDTVKYLIYGEIEIGGLVEKPDVVGAVFGQTEGLLGDDLDLRDLQKNGRIGRIEVDLNARGGKTIGTVKVPSSLDMVETSIIAASLEAVDRVGPCDAKVKVLRIEDTRNQKRKVLVDRAKTLLKKLLNTEIPESKEISQLVREQVKTAEVTEYGPDKLAAGPGIDKLNEIILVEGRADVINLLKNDIQNVISIGGAKVPRGIVELSRGKEVTAFLDGDRGGDIILNELIQAGVELDFVARAPVGKEVEELTRKEIIKVLRSKVPVEQAEEQKSKPFAQPYQTPRRFLVEQPQMVRAADERERERREEMQAAAQQQPAMARRELPRLEPVKPIPMPSVKPMMERIEQLIKPHGEEAREPAVEKETVEPQQERESEAPVQQKLGVVKKSKDELMAELNELNNTLKARLYARDGVLAREVPVRDVIKAMSEHDGIETVVFDGIITQRLVDIAAGKGVKMIIGMKQGNVTKKPEALEIITKSK
ncbi:DNA primase DnaG [uncultured archaeon]|nr:DNA primase DnaG [uncultured archaeon]